MIIRFTVNDNDFGELIERFLSNIHSNVLYDINRAVDTMDSSDSKNRDLFIEYFHKTREVNEIMNPNCHHDMTDDDFKSLEERIKTAFKAFVLNSNHKDSVDYLMKNLEITFPPYVEDKWENGEAFYWMQHSDTLINQ